MLKAREKGLKCSKNNFWWLLRNPIYHGKISVPAYKDEELKYVEGQHEPIISEKLFYEAQDALNGKKKIQRTKIKCDEMLPLRGFLQCSKCSRMLTGSASSGRGGKYYYYHCSSQCGCRFKAEVANEVFIRDLEKFTPHPAVIELYKKLIIDAYKSGNIKKLGTKKDILAEIEDLNKRLNKARKLLFDETLEPSEYKEIKKECDEQIRALESKLPTFDKKKEDITQILVDACKNLVRLDKIFQNADVEKRREIIGSMFPENLIFEKHSYRTTNMNEAVRLGFNVGAAFSEKKNGTN
jgi:hypothetical protein